MAGKRGAEIAKANDILKSAARKFNTSSDEEAAYLTIIKDGVEYPDFKRFAEEFRMYNGKKWVFDDIEYIIPVYQSLVPEKSIMKSTKVTVTEFNLNIVAGFMMMGKTKGIYMMPTEKECGELIVFRLNPVFEEIWGGKYELEVDSREMKQIGGSFLAIRPGTVIVRNVEADYVICDEFEGSPAENLTLTRDRLGFSKIKWLIKTSNPRLANCGIHREFLDGDQQHWHIKCYMCGHEYPLCCSFYLGGIDEKDGKWEYVCPACRETIDRWKYPGFWVPYNSAVSDTHASWHITRLIDKRYSAEEIIKHRDKFRRKQDYDNSILGLPSEEEKQLNDADVRACIQHQYKFQKSGINCFMGIDQGYKNLFVVVLRRDKDGRLIMVWMGAIPGWKNNAIRSLRELMYQYQIYRAVIDRDPEYSHAENFASEFRGRAYTSKPASWRNTDDVGIYKWEYGNESSHVQVHRTAMIEGLFHLFRTRNMILPDEEIIEEFIHHCLGVVKDTDRSGEDSRGIKEIKYTRKWDDHYFMACCLAVCASAEFVDMEGQEMEIEDIPGPLDEILPGMSEYRALLKAERDEIRKQREV